MPRIVNEIPLSLATNIEQATARYERGDFAADYAIAGQPWLSAVSDERSLSRITTTYQKERVDQASSVGESSLTNWWLRSATSWHRGEGAYFYDADESTLFRYRESYGIDVWTQGQLSLLHKTEIVYDDEVTSLVPSQNGVWFIADSGILHYFDGATSTHMTTVATHGFGRRVASAGLSAFFATDTAIWRVQVGGTITKLYEPPATFTSWTIQAIAYVKDRLIVAATVGSHTYVWQLASIPASPPVKVDIAQAIFTNVDAVQFTAITETTAAVLVSYNIGSTSRVMSFTIDRQGTPVFGLPTLTDGATVAELPSGETLLCMKSYLSTYVVLGTTKGLRIGIENQSGTGFTYGPIVVPGAVHDVAFFAEYVYATRGLNRNGSYGLWRVNLGEQVDNAYAYAADLNTGLGVPSSLAFIESTGEIVIGTQLGLHMKSDVYEDSGYLLSGRIRYGTGEAKQPVSLRIQNSGEVGSVGIKLTNRNGAVASFPVIPLLGTADLQVSNSLSPDEDLEIEVTLKDSGTDTPIFEQWQLRSLPAPERSRTITIPLLCFDEEKDSNGQVRYSDAWSRYMRLEQLERAGIAVLLQDFATGEERICQIRALQFEQTTPPPFKHGYGGIVTVQLQTVDKG